MADQMEEYMENVKRLRSHMNDIEEAAAKRSVEEEKQKTAITALEIDLDLVRAETKRLDDDAQVMLNDKSSIVSLIAEKQNKISSLDTESRTLSQTVELLQQEMISMLLKLKEKRLYYSKVTEELNLKLLEHQEWYNSFSQKMKADAASTDADEEMVLVKGNEDSVLPVKVNFEKMDGENNGRYRELVIELDNAKTKLEELERKKSELVEARIKSNQLLEEMNNKMQAAPPAFREMDFTALEEEQKSLVADKTGELEYMQSLEQQINQLKSISYTIKCQCGKEYSVDLVN